jgi:xanthine dehydrogenase molybdenum-binding subunit
VARLISANDLGKAINPRQVEGQILGGAIQGLGSALFEEVLINKDGVVMNANMHDYKMPTIGDCPDDIIAILVESQPHPDGPFGAKGVGEPAMACPAAAIANAVANALGIRLYTMPLTPESVLKALWEKKGESAGIPRRESAGIPRRAEGGEKKQNGRGKEARG